MSRGRGDGDRLVYSSEQGRVCPECGRAAAKCRCRAKGLRSHPVPRGAGGAPATGDGIVRVGRSTKGRKGKTVSTVTGVPADEDELRALAADLKRRCGTGGALKDGVIEIQGDHRDTLVAELEARGFQVKRAGG